MKFRFMYTVRLSQMKTIKLSKDAVMLLMRFDRSGFVSEAVVANYVALLGWCPSDNRDLFFGGISRGVDYLI